MHKLPVYRLEARDKTNPTIGTDMISVGMARIEALASARLCEGTDRAAGLAVMDALIAADAVIAEPLFGPDGSHRLVLVATGPATDSVAAVNR